MEDGTRRTGSGRRRREDDVAKKISRRKFLAATGAATAIAQVARPDVAQQNSVKIGLMTVKTGGLAAGGVHLEEGITCFLKDKTSRLRDERSNLLWPIRPACRRPPRPKQSNWWSAIRSTLSWDRSLPLNGSPLKIISANTRCRQWDLAALRISPSGIAIRTRSGHRTVRRSAFIRLPTTPARK